MATQSESVHHHKASSIVSRAQLARHRGTAEQLSALVVLIISLVGTTFALNSFLISLAVQALLTWVEWAYYRTKLAFFARIVDATLTAIGYGPMVADRLVAALVVRGVSDATVITLPWLGAMSLAAIGAWAIIGVVSWLIAWYPESRLVD